MDSQSNIITFRQPDNYQKIVDYSKTNRNSFQEVRKAAVQNKEEIEKILKMMITNSRFENCIPNNGYIKALGFKAE